MFNKSHGYNECMKLYMDKKGKLRREDRERLQNEFDTMVERVLAATDILFTTASNCGDPLLESGAFVPTVIFCDEAGQISIPSLSVPLVTFTKWEGIFFFGDIQQLEPTSLSTNFNEFKANGKVSPLALLAMKNYQTYLLDTQYRMVPSCSKFPRVQFYDDKGLKDSEMVKEDNPVRQTLRNMTKDLGVKGEKGEGTEYLVCDVPNGCSRVELHGILLVNHANADVIISMIERLLKAGTITAHIIKILTYYTGQLCLIRDKISKTG